MSLAHRLRTLCSIAEAISQTLIMLDLKITVFDWIHGKDSGDKVSLASSGILKSLPSYWNDR